MKYKKWLLPGAILWIVGLVSAIVGLNIHNGTGEWIRVIGEILFFLGLLLESVAFLLSKRDGLREENGAEGDRTGETPSDR